MSLDRASRLNMYAREAHSRIAPYVLQVLMDMVADGKISIGDAVLVAMFLGGSMILSAVTAFADGDAQEAERILGVVFSWIRRDVERGLKEDALSLH